ncbi:MAG: 2-isopropylmalate synthase [Planctomycetes bacterium ADurb.Bin126]|nr:MAG: 2-isopropylmalate synthase [Planctomycetes bacterium ADurb.Bin126]HOD83769.1 2-isopropylmalate synthase [Phycisphaerae bacterium]
MSEKRKITIFDTTLRDGEQSPGCSMNLAEKLEVARALQALGVDVIEAGFAIASPGDFEAVQAVAGEVAECTVASLARCTEKDIDAAIRAVKAARKPRIHVFCATSEIHRTHKLRRAKEEIIRMSVEGVKMAKGFCQDVEFSPEDASRTEPDFLVEVVTAVIEAGATTVNIPDTVGYAMPAEFGDLIRHLRAHVPNIDRAVISVHCHNDLGMAVANSLAAVRAGAGQVECTINGLGERAGNAALEEIVMAIQTRHDFLNVTTNIRTQKIYPTSRLVASVTGLNIQRNKAVVGENAFAHESGIHQHGMLAHRETYEIMCPEDIGVPSSKLVLGKHSGRHAFKQRCEALGYSLGDKQIDHAFEKFKVLADKKKDVFDRDIEALIDEQMELVTEMWTFGGVQTVAGSQTTPTATVVLLRDNQPHTDAAIGDGPVDAVYEAIGRITGIRPRLTDYQLRAITSGKDAQGEVTIEVELDGKRFRTRGVSTDIVEASARAFLAAVNRAAMSANHVPDKPPQP